MLKAGETESVDSVHTSIHSGLPGARLLMRRYRKFVATFGDRSLLWRTKGNEESFKKVER